ncbi:hypothetical protein ACTMQP_10210 [Pseudomonas aeruginosa]|uniref:hypothetical protein n=1 Tax=Pseudomonas aeruginosa TaxID=287 RepID=UPI002B267916|nr:hypothetical protein [Pseudomonas aeruginosa]MEA8493903.1 hypothetical protein [Pseudomonas aeruginosa]HBO9691334.1 hypothetical protein [Pseudomonas aeruginosa]
MAEKDISHDIAMAKAYKKKPGDLAAMITAFIKEGASFDEWKLLIRQIIETTKTKGRNQN